MVSNLDSGQSSPDGSLVGVTVLYSWDNLVVPLAMQVLIWVLVKFILGATLRWTSILYWRGVKIILVA